LEEQLELDLLDEGIAADDHQYFVHIAPTNLIECDEVILGALDKKSYDFIAESECYAPGNMTKSECQWKREVNWLTTLIQNLMD
jgi:hypothetical protein